MANQQETKIFAVKLNQPSHAYCPGEIVSGSVIVDYPKEKVVENISVTFHGRSKVRFNRGLGKYSISDTFVAHRTYFVKRCPILLIRDANQKVKIPAGLNEFPFSYKLPLGLPTSFFGEYGKISYKIKAAMTRPGILSSTSNAKCAFKIHAPVDLNSNVENRNPISITKTLTWDSNKSLNFTFNLAQSGFIPGDMLLGSLDIDNQTNRNEIQQITISLAQIARFIANERFSRNLFQTQDSKHNISTIYGPSVPALGKYSWIVDSLQIPPNIAPMQSDPTHLILLKYAIRIEITIGGIIREFDIPIAIGTIPVTTTKEQSQINWQREVATAPPVNNYGEHAQLELPPPSYQQAIGSSTQKFKSQSQVVDAKYDR